ncbi:hypothetical protein AMJ86_03375 [bacterium SM23_57]|nr:MAG: hypothetical protein AMJ86_03375 [bacterium SM23_57]
MEWNRKKRQYLAILGDPNCRLSRKEIADKIKVCHATLRNWERETEFRNALSELKSKRGEDSEWATLKFVIYEKALGGDVAAAKLLLQMREMNLASGKEAGITVDEAVKLISNHLTSAPKPSMKTDSKN